MNKKQNNRQRAKQTRKISFCAVLICMIVTTATLVTISATTTSQSNSTESSDTQFKIDLTYAYVGETSANASYHSRNGVLMSPVSQYSSAVIISSTRIPGQQFPACDAEIEVYKITIATEKGLKENYYYFIGTNYKPTISTADLSALSNEVHKLVSSKSYSITGDFRGNVTENTSILSVPVGSAGLYSNHKPGLGLWKDGEPSAITVAAQRVGYITIGNGKALIHLDKPDKPATATSTLEHFGNGFLKNHLVPESKLSRSNLFHPEP